MTNVYRCTKVMFPNHKNILLWKKSPSKLVLHLLLLFACLNFVYYADA